MSCHGTETGETVETGAAGRLMISHFFPPDSRLVPTISHFVPTSFPPHSHFIPTLKRCGFNVFPHFSVKFGGFFYCVIACQSVSVVCQTNADCRFQASRQFDVLRFQRPVQYAVHACCAFCGEIDLRFSARSGLLTGGKKVAGEGGNDKGEISAER